MIFANIRRKAQNALWAEHRVGSTIIRNEQGSVASYRYVAASRGGRSATGGPSDLHRRGLSWELPPGYQDEGAVWCAIVQLLLQPILYAGLCVRACARLLPREVLS